MKKHDISDELLGAYVDDELACAENRSIAEQIKYDSELAAKAGALVDLKQALKQAYPENIYQETHPTGLLPVNVKKGFLRSSIAASVVLGLGLMVGFYSSTQLTPAPRIANADSQLYGIQVKPVAHSQDKILMHISTADIDKLEFLMNKAESLLQEHHLDKTNFKLDVIANSDGIELLKKGSSPYEKRLIELTQKYDNLKLIACKNTLSRLKKQGQQVQVINGVQIDTPALDTIVNRIDKGWTYVKI